MDEADPSEQFRERWDQLAAPARDENLLGGGYDRPLLEVIEASRGTGLRRFFPFTSMASLRFACSSTFPFQDIQPAVVEFLPGRGCVVRGSGPYHADRVGPIALNTADPAAAVVAMVMRLLGI